MVDVGKTLSKVSLWSRSGGILDRQVRPNAAAEVDGLNRIDMAGIGGWLVEALARYAAHPVEHIIPVADTALDLIGAKERLLIEGRFAEAEVFVRALASLRPDTAVYVANAHNDVSFGALRLVDPALAPRGELSLVQPLDADLGTYRSRWHTEVGAMA